MYQLISTSNRFINEERISSKELIAYSIEHGKASQLTAETLGLDWSVASIAAPPLPSSVVSDKLFNLNVYHSPSVYNGENSSTYLIGLLWKLNGLIFVKYLEKCLYFVSTMCTHALSFKSLDCEMIVLLA